MPQQKIRLFLVTFVTLVISILMTFLWAINLNQPDSLKTTLNTYLLVLGGFACITLAVFFLKAEIFDENGRLESNRILAMTTVVLLIAQLTFAFANYAYQQLNFTFVGNKNARQLFTQMQTDMKSYGDKAIIDTKSMTERLSAYTKIYKEIDTIVIVDAKDVVQFASDASQIEKKITTDPLNWHSFPIHDQMLDGRAVRMHISADYRKNMINNILAELLTVMAASIFLTIELMLFVIRYIGNRVAPPEKINGISYCSALCYVRQIAFLFYFSSRMASSFIPVLALKLGGSLFGLSGTVLAGIPQSAETLLTCAAIFLTSTLIERRGWKLPFMAGLLLVAAGTLMSAYSPNIVWFIVSRMIVGLGYGFCWMTLRNFALFGRNEEEKAEGFSRLNAGLYAGINCGSVLGAILAEQLGYTPVFLMATLFTILCSLMIIRLENKTYCPPVLSGTLRSGTAINLSSWAVLGVFVILMIAPTCIIGAYLGYYLPLYFTNIGHSIADVGRAQLLYGLMIIYAGPPLARIIARRFKLGTWNMAYNILLGISLVIAGIFGGFIPAMFAVLLIGLADSFGFVAQNNYFLKLKAVKRLGESTALSYLSFIKKLAEMLGPIVFGLAISGITTTGILTIGAGIIIFAVLYMILPLRKD